MSNTSKQRKPKPRLFTKDVKALMYAYGDVEEPLTDSVNAVEDILMNYIVDLCHEAHAYSKVTLRQKVRVDDFKFALRKDPFKFGRLEELLKMQKTIESARKQFDNSEGKSMKSFQVDEDDDGEGGDGINADGTSTKRSTDKPAKKSAKKDDNRPKRKYTKSGKERKPYKKRAKKGETQGPVIKAAAPSSAV